MKAIGSRKQLEARQLFLLSLITYSCTVLKNSGARKRNSLIVVYQFSILAVH